MNLNHKRGIIIISMIFLAFICTSSIVSANELDLTNETIALEEDNLEVDAGNEVDDIQMNEIYVKNDAENISDGSEAHPYKTIKEAVDYGNNQQNPVIIHIHAGTYDETNMTITNNMIIKSVDGDVTLDGNNQGWFFYSNNSSNYLSLIGLTFKNGIRYDYYDSTEGGVIKTEGHLDVVNCTFENNFGGTGGGIHSQYGANVINSTFKNNKAEYSGAGIYNLYGQTNIINCTFHANTAKRQGGAVRVQGDTYIEDSTFTDNYAGTGNYAGNGGAVRVTDGDLNIESSTFRNNSAKFEGGAVSAGDDNQYSQTHYQLNINNSTFVDNKARTGAGIIANDGINLTNSILANNSVPYSISARYGLGAGLYVLNGDANLIGNTIENNTNPYNKWDTQDIYSYQGNVAEEDNNWGSDDNSRIKTNSGKTTHQATTQPTVNKPEITIQTGENNKPDNGQETVPNIDDSPTTENNGTNPENTQNSNSNGNKTQNSENTNTAQHSNHAQKSLLDTILSQITNTMNNINKQINSQNNAKQAENTQNLVKTNSSTDSQNTNADLGEQTDNDESSKTESGSDGESGQESSVAREVSAIKSTIIEDHLTQSIVIVLIVLLAFIIGYKRKQKEND